MTARRLLLASGSALLMAPLFQGSAVAAPEKEVISLTCGTTTHQIVVNGNGDFTPGRDFTSTWVFIPHAFGPFTGVIRNAAGEVQETFTEPAFVQGSGKQPRDLTCTYSIHFVGDGTDEFLPLGWTFHGSGTVTGQATPRR